jgi:uncharacterized membrane protein YdjX (TVP38/TMEM64 family)
MWPEGGVQQRSAWRAKLMQGIRLGAALGVLLAAVLGLVTTSLGAQLWALVREPTPAHLSQLLADTPMWLPIAFIGFMILHTLIPIPAELLALAAGMTLGPLWGTVTIWVGAMLGAYLGFFLSRVLGEPFLRSLVSAPRFTRLQGWLQQADVPLLLAARLLPVISFNLVNFALGLSTISWWRFTWTTAIGILPVTVFVVVFGAHLNDWRMLVLMTLAGGLVAWGGYRLWRRQTSLSEPCTLSTEGTHHGPTKH